MRKNVAVMQPYFFPYHGYYELLATVDTFVLYDDAAFTKRSWFNRNRLLSREKGWSYFRVSVVKQPQGTPVKNIELHDKASDLQLILNLLDHNYRSLAPHYDDVKELVKTVFETSDNSLCSLAVSSLTAVCDYLDLDVNLILSSELEYDRSSDAQEKILQMCEATGATDYTNLPGGRDLYDEDIFSNRNINLRFLEVPQFEYPVINHVFEANLSILDVLLWNDRNQIRKYI